MTKQQHSATSLPPSKLCRLLIIAFSFKLVVLGMLLFDPSFPGAGEKGPHIAEAATAEGAAAPPAVEAGLPDAGMRPGGPVADPLSPGSPATLSGTGSLFPEGDGNLPLIGQPSSPVPATGNGTEERIARDALARRQEDLARKEQELRVLESELASRLEKMQMLENRLGVMIKEAEETKDAKLRHLVDVLANMKSKQAAAVLETLDPKIAVRVLAGMRGRQAGEILTFVRPEIAAKLTESLARMQMPLE